MWKVLLALFLILVIVLLYSNDMNAQKSVDSLKTKASSLAAAPAAESAPAASEVPAAPAVDAPAEPKKEGFCPKLMQKYGFCDAGESMNNPARGSVWDQRLNRGASAIGAIGRGRESMTGRDIAQNTVWSGYMGSKVLPY